MRWRISMTVEPDTGNYEIQFENLEHPGEGVEYNQLRAMITRVLQNMDQRVAQAQQSAPAGEASVELPEDTTTYQ